MLIIFDWDGTLCDSTGRIVAAMRQAARELGVPEPSADAVREVIGLGLPEAMQAVFPALDSVARDAMRARYSETYLALDREPAPLFSGALEVLESLRGRGHGLAVATGKGRSGLDRVLHGHGLSDYFDGTRCADETRSKPHPHMVFELLELLAFEPGEALVVGDSEYDLQMACAAGVASVGVSYGVHSVARLQRHAPLAVIDQLVEMLALTAASD